jgi:hypothetical protein
MHCGAALGSAGDGLGLLCVHGSVWSEDPRVLLPCEAEALLYEGEEGAWVVDSRRARGAVVCGAVLGHRLGLRVRARGLSRRWWAGPGFSRREKRGPTGDGS